MTAAALVFVVAQAVAVDAPRAAAAELRGDVVESAWADPSPHTVRFVDVAPNVKLEVLDWGGRGRDIVLLTGSGHTAHVYDDLGPLLRASGHVYAITRRGYGASSRPSTGYDDQRLADDVSAVVRALALQAPVLIGHSMAGGEMTTVARQHPGSIGGLVYLDALADPRDSASEDPAWRALNEKLPPPVVDCPEDLTSFAAFTAAFACRAGAALPEAAFRSSFEGGSDGRVGRFTSSRAIHEAIGAGHIRRDYAGIRVPVLAFVDLPRTTFDDLPRAEQPRTDADREALSAFAEATRKVIRRWEGQLRRQVVDVRIIEMVGAGHYLFATRQRDVVDETGRFLQALQTEPAAGGAIEPPKPVSSAWTDPSPHTVRFVHVSPNVKLEVLDWGGTGRDIVLLTGSGHTAHVYDEFAVTLKLKGAYHVYGITRRGYGASSVPESGYDEPSLSNDVWTVIKTLGLKSPILIGHSMAGAELTGVGMLHSDAIGGLVYLDALGDSTDDPPADPGFKALQPKLPPPGPRPDCPRDRTSFAAFRASLACSNGLFLPEAELRAGFAVAADGSVGSAKSPGWVSRAIGTGRPPRNYSQIKVPVLALQDAVDFDLTQLKPDQPQPRTDEERAIVVQFGKALQAVFDRWSANLKKGVPGAKVVDMPGAGHYLWMTNEGAVLREIHAFIAAIPAK